MRGSIRDDIDGLRGVAIASVILFHVEMPGFSGGFIGVDVFFVISGFLITAILWREIAATGRVTLAPFWARRVRRVIPLACFVLVVTALASMLFLSPLSWQDAAKDIVVSALYVSNFSFAGRANGYFDAELESSPALHMWSLSVEEQFYLIWPLIFWALARATRGSAARARAAALTLGALIVLSFALGVALTWRGSASAFFSSSTRAWQFACGGALALLPSAPRGLSSSLLAAAGALAIGISACAFSERTAYPGFAALAPTLGAAALIAAGSASRGWVTRALSFAPLTWIGRHSYAWYLWHWPLIVFVNAQTEDGTQRFGLFARIAAALLALGLAVVTRPLVEERVRFHPGLVGSPSRSLALGAAFCGAVLLAAAGLVGADAFSARAPFQARLREARLDKAGWGDCAMPDLETLVANCSVGAPSGTPALLVGDSHARHWLPALERSGHSLGMRITYAGRGGCPSLPVHVRERAMAFRAPECIEWQDGLLELIDALGPRIVIVSNSSNYLERILDEQGALVDAPGQALKRWSDALVAFASAARERGIALVVLHDTPRLEIDPLWCAARAGTFDGCVAPAHAITAAVRTVHAAERAALAAAKHGDGFDPLPLLCEGDACPPVRGEQIVFRDTGHMTTQFAASLAPALEPVLREALAASERLIAERAR